MNPLTRFLTAQKLLNQAEAQMHELRQTLENHPNAYGCPFVVGGFFSKNEQSYRIEKIRIERSGKCHYWVAFGRCDTTQSRASVSAKIA